VTLQAQTEARLLRRGTFLALVLAAWGVVFVVANRSFALVARAETFSGFVGAPIVGGIHVPFTWFGHREAIGVFRVVDLVCIVAAVLIVVCTLPRPSRVIGSLVAVGALTLSYPLITTLEFGQFHGLVMLGLAAGIWGVANDRLSVTGIGLGLAATLKLSPIILIVYLCFRGRRRVVVPAAVTAAALAGIAMLLGRPSAGFEWLVNVVPKLSGGTRAMRNQSLPALLDRVSTGSDDLLTKSQLGGLRVLGPLLAVALGFALWRLCRARCEVEPLELGGVIVVLLLAGPLSWDHYYVWAVIPIVLACNVDRWAAVSPALRTTGVMLLGVALLALSLPVPELQPAVIRADWGLRASGSPYPIAALLLLVVIGILLSGNPGRASSPRAGAASLHTVT
jgi:hypothetical protein